MSVRGRTCRGGVIALAALLALVAARPARANPEPPANYDARVAAMGGAAVATANNPSALFHNPARLDQIERFAITAVATSLLVNLQAPFAGPGTEQESTEQEGSEADRPEADLAGTDATTQLVPPLA